MRCRVRGRGRLRHYPDQRTSRLPEASQKASPKRIARNRAHQRLVEVFHGLDEMRLAEDEVDGVRLDEGNTVIPWLRSCRVGTNPGRPPEGCKPPQAAAAVEASARDTSGLTFDSSHLERNRANVIDGPKPNLSTTSGNHGRLPSMSTAGV